MTYQDIRQFVYPIILSVSVVCLSLLSAGCGGGDEPPTKSSDKIIYRAEGGVAKLNGQVTLTIPAGAISEDTEVEFAISEEYPALPEGYGFASPVYDISLAVGQVIDTVYLAVTYLDGLLPDGVLEATLMIARHDGQSWTIFDPSIDSYDNQAELGTTDLLGWAVIWPEQQPRQTARTIITGIHNDISVDHRADFDLGLGDVRRAELETSLAGFLSAFDAHDNAEVDAAILAFLAANRAIENDGGIIVFETAAQLAQAYLDLGLATGYYTAVTMADPPEIPIGNWKYLPPAFAALFVNSPGYTCEWSRGKAGTIQTTDQILQDFFVQLNYVPTFGGLSYLDPPEQVQRQSRVLSNRATGTYRIDMVVGANDAGHTIYYDYYRDRELVLYWPINTEIVMFNLLGTDNSVNALSYSVEFGDILADFQWTHENGFSSAAQEDSLGAWVYFGLPVEALINQRKQEGMLNLVTWSGSVGTTEELYFPVNRRPVLGYGDWTAPSAVTDLVATEYWGNSVRLEWTAPGNDLDTGRATYYDIRFYDQPITEDNWAVAGQLLDEPAPRESAEHENYVLLPYDLSRTTYLAVRTLDQDLNTSELSNVIQLANLDELEVNFPDGTLDALVRLKSGVLSGQLYGSDLAGITTFSAVGQGIFHLAGMQYLSNLTVLNLKSNLQIDDINPLEHLIRLEWLNLSANNFGEVSALEKLTNLKVLDLTSNRVADLSALAGMTALDTLAIRYNEVANLDALSGLENLKYLELGTNNISDIAPLGNLHNLEYLNLELNNLMDITPLEGLDKLKTLDMSSNRILDITVLEFLTGLDDLDLSNNLFTDLTPLVNNPGIAAGDHIDLRQCPLSSRVIQFQVGALLDRGVEVLYTPLGE